MDTSPDGKIQHNFNAIVSLRLAIIFCGTKTPPNVGHMMLLSNDDEVIDVGEEALNDPKKTDWELYELHEEIECPIHRLGCPPWLVRGAQLVLGPALKFGEIDPMDWVTNLREVHAAIPSTAIEQPEAQELLEWFASAADKSEKERVDIIREAIKVKVEAIKQPDRCPGHGAHDGPGNVNVVVIGL